MLFYLGFKLIDIKHDLRLVRLHMQRVAATVGSDNEVHSVDLLGIMLSNCAVIQAVTGAPIQARDVISSINTVNKPWQVFRASCQRRAGESHKENGPQH
jgi:hypothetical protein